jgi:DhnA family fructose-bisphosphate aldolase class Ia
MTYGLARALDGWPHRLSLVLQCFGAPKGQSKSQIASVSQAITLDAAAVSVQLSWADTELASRLREICAFTSEAHSASLPVLYMIGGESNTSALPHAIRVCQELGADLIKINCSLDNFMCDHEDVKSVLRYGPPVLMAGGAVSQDIFQFAQNAARLGFSGYCVGRNIFHANDPSDVVVQLNTIFSNESKGVAK